MGRYAGQAKGYSANAQAVKIKLETIKQKYSALLDGFGVSKVNGELNYSVGEGDYLTDNVVENMDTTISEIDNLIAEIDGRVSDISAEANRLDIEEEELAKNDTSSEDATSSESGDISG